MLRLAFAVLAASAFSFAHAQQAPAPKAAEVVTTSPGKGTIAQTLEVSAIVVGIDKAARTVDLKGPKGRVFTLAVSDDVKNFDQIQLNDSLVVRYARALTLELKKTGSQVMERSEKSGAVVAKPGERPGVAGARQIHALANVVALNKKTLTVTLKGPKGNLVDLVLQDPKQFALVKVGDQVDAVYTEAVALSVEAAPKAAAKPAAKAK